MKWCTQATSETLGSHRCLKGDPVRAVFGNIDGKPCASNGLNMRHRRRGPGLDDPRWTSPDVRQRHPSELTLERPDLFVCGHSHILLVKQVPAWGGLHMNPGAAGVSGFHKVRTMLKFDLEPRPNRRPARHGVGTQARMNR